MKNKSNNDEDFPDLIIIDGGKGQLSMAKKAMEKTNISNIEIISISKGENRNDGNEIIHTLKEEYCFEKIRSFIILSSKT